jgi:fumarylacetoacetate (FAA) hydrolase
VIGSGTVSNRDRSAGCACLAEKRALEAIEHGEPRTPFLRFGDRVRIEMLDEEGRSIFGAIDQQMAPLAERGPVAAAEPESTEAVHAQP